MLLWEGIPRLDLSVALPSRRCTGRRSLADHEVRVARMAHGAHRYLRAAWLWQSV